MLGITRSRKSQAAKSQSEQSQAAGESSRQATATPRRRRLDGSGSTGTRRSFVSARTAIMIAIGVTAVILLALPMREYLRQHSEISSAETQLAEQRQRVDELQRRVDQWSNDDFVRGQARERLHFLLPGEVGYVVIGPNGGTDELSEQAPKAEEAKGPWYGKLWSSVQAADRNE